MLVLGGHDAGNAAEGPYPGLPRHVGNGGWVGAPQTGITEAVKARQWAQIPMHTAAVFVRSRVIEILPGDPLNREQVVELTNYVYLVAPSGSDDNYGVSPKFKVRTVAFGAIPVEATVQLVQRRKDGLPVPIVASAQTVRYNLPPGGDPSAPQPVQDTDTLIEDDVTLRVTGLAVDGVDLRLDKRCQTAEPGKLSLLGKGFWRHGDVDSDHPLLTGHYTPGAGGLITGSVDVPVFAGCITSAGEDVSRLLTSAVSGRDNPVRLHVGAPGCNYPLPPPSPALGPPPPGATTPESAGCVADFVPPLIPIP